jgi:hypothetical protein
MSIGYCKHCKCDEFTTVKRQDADGHWVVYRQCNKCFCVWDGKFIAKERYAGWERLPMAHIKQEQNKCQRCGSISAQLHHYFPRGLAPNGVNPDSWPMEYLCDDCHKLWHDNVTPGLLDKNWKAAKHGK